MTNKKQSITKVLGLALSLLLPGSMSAKMNFSSVSSTLEINGSTSQLILGTILDTFGGTLLITPTSDTSITQTATTNVINFTNTGLMNYGGAVSTPAGTYNPLSGASTLILNGNKTAGLTGDVAQSLTISNSFNYITGVPNFLSPLTLQDSNAYLNLGITSKLTSNIVMNSGTIILTEDLYFKDNVQLTGTGTVKLNHFSIQLPVYTTTLTHNLTFEDANDVTVNSRTSLTGTWTFTGSTANLMGRGVILDLTGGGTLAVGNNTTLYVNGLHIKGLGATGGGSFTLGNSSSKIYFTNCTLELAGSFTQTQGTAVIEGTGCKLLCHPGEKYIVSGASTVFKVDAQILEYDVVNQLPTYPFQTASGGTMSLVNGGDIRSSYIPGTAQNINLTIASGTGDNLTDSNVDLTSGGTLTFVNPNIANPYSMIFNGQNNTVEFGNGSGTAITVQQNVTLTFKNVRFVNFDPAKILLQGSGSNQAKIIFGDSVTFCVEKNLSISANQLSCVGNANFIGYGSPTLTLSTSSIVFNPTSTATLAFRGLRVLCSTFNSIKAASTSYSNILFQNAEVFMTSTGLTLDTGNIIVQDLVTFNGVHESVPEGTTSLNFTSTGLFTILGASALTINPDVIFNYSPSIASDGGVAAVQKRHLRFINPSSTLYFKRGQLNVGSMGLAIDYGKLIIDDLVTVNTTTTAGKEFELGVAANTTILNNGILNVIGLIKYMPTTYP